MLTTWRIYRRLPWIRVAEPRDCGASVFASIARFYHHHLTLEQARILVSTNRDGTTLAGLRDGGRAIGFDARPAQAIYDALAHLQLPAVAHLNGQEGHYVIIVQWSPTGVLVLNPTLGLKRLTRDAFVRSWSGYVVEFRPTPALQPRRPDVQPTRLLLRLAWTQRGILAVALICALLAISLGWAASFFLQTLFDAIVPDRNRGLLAALGAGMLLISVLQASLHLGRLWLAAFVGKRVHLAQGTAFIRRLLGLPMKVFDTHCVSGLVMRSIQVDLIQLALTEGMIGLVADIAMFLVALGIIFAYDPLAGLVAAAALPAVVGVLLLLNERVYSSQFDAMVRIEDFAAHMLDAFDALRTIRVFSAEQRYQTLLHDHLERLTQARFANRIAGAFPTAWSAFATAIITAGVLWYGGSRVLSGAMTPGELLVLFGLITFYLTPVQRLPSTVLSLRGALIGLERLAEIELLPSEQEERPHTHTLTSVSGQITFDRVSFAYTPHRPVLREVSFTITPGQTVAIVGETGSGKTSLANLIAGFYLPTAGEVRIDGISTREIDPRDLRTAVSAVFQTTRLLQHSIFENITMLHPTPEPDVHRVAQLANADGFIRQLPNGYATQVARGGDNFSSGQAQRIELARALLKDAPILILDEATSNLDSATERGILQTLAANRRGRTTVVIGHRLSTVMHADQIIVLDQGRVVEVGTHTTLLAQQGRYVALFGQQLVATTSTPADPVLIP